MGSISLAGCVLGELIGRKPFLPGNNYLDQLELILQLVMGGESGLPDAMINDFVSSDNAKNVLKRLIKKNKAKLSHEDEYYSNKVGGTPDCIFDKLKVLFPTTNPLLLDFMSKLLVFNPNERSTIDVCICIYIYLYLYLLIQ